MKFHKIAFAIVTIASLTPVIASASPEKASLKACARAFASSVAGPGVAAPAFKLDYRGGQGSAIAEFYPTEYTFTLQAHDPKSGAVVARAVCSTNSRGDVTTLASMPLEKQTATLASGY